MLRKAAVGRDDRRWTRRPLLILLVLIESLLPLVGATAAAPVPAAPPAPAPTVGSTALSQGWTLVSANNVTDGGATVSQVGYNTSGWYPISVPSTVLAGLVANGVYQNIYFGLNLQSVPDLTTQHWWYRTGFTAPAGVAGQQYWLRFTGISYRAQIWLNGTELDANAVGTMVVHEYNVTNVIHPGAANALAVLVTPPATGCNDLSFCTVDWNPPAPDMNAGLWGKVLLDTSGPVVLRDPYVKTVLPLPATNAADLTAYVDAVNGTASPVTGTLTGTISKPGYPTITVAQTVTLAANERREISFDPGTFSQLHVANPALWWPYQFGTPDLYQLSMSFTVGGQTSDTRSISFGIRQFTDYRTTVNGVSFVGYKVNGKPILFRGGGYVWDMLQRWDTATNETHMRYVKDMGLNIVRFEGTLGNQELYDIADREGIMLMAGFVCCSAWENESKWTAEQQTVANNSLDSQMRALRAHASAMVWAFGSDKPPLSGVLSGYKAIATALHWQNPTLDNVATWANANAGMKMDGPYKWEPPVLWWDTTQAGSAFGTTAEEGTEAPPPAESIQKFMAPADQWPIGAVWNYHAGAPKSVFDNITVYSDGVNQRYGTATGLSDFSAKSELMSYENTRAFFEAWNGNEYTTSFGAIFWMLDNAWPSVHWNLYDYYFKPGGGYFGAKKADEPVHILYDYVGHDVRVVNSTLTDYSAMTASATVYNIPSLTQQYTTQLTLNVPANKATQAMALPISTLSGLSTTYFIRLQLKDAAGQVVSNNLYWYSTSPDVLGNKSNWYMTAVSHYADLTGLNSLAMNNGVATSAVRTVANGQETVSITLRNTSPSAIAFFVRAEVTAGNGGPEVLPVTYTDNDVSLWPGESTTLTAQYATAGLGGQPAYIRVRGYNVPVGSIAVP